MTLLEIQHTFKDEYYALGNEERKELVREYNENIDGTKHLTCPSPHGRIQDFSNTVRNLIMLVCDLITFSVHFLIFERSMALRLVLVLKGFFVSCETHRLITFNLSGSSLVIV